MPVHNTEISELFKNMADLLDIEGANPFRVRAYRNAARTIQGLSKPVADMIEEGYDLTEIPGIGKDLAGKIEEIVTTGTLAQLEELKKQTSPEVTKLLRIEGLGPQRVQTLHEELGITTLKDLEKAGKQKKIQQLEGFGEKIQDTILEELKRVKEKKEERILLMRAEEIVSPLLKYLKTYKGLEDVTIAGSYRRQKETVGDIDILATGEVGRTIIHHFVNYEDVKDVISQGETRSTVRLRSGLQIDLRVIPGESYGAALLYFTGSKAHNVHLRKMAQENDLKINEYGVFEGKKQIAGKAEKEIYALFDLPYIPPELREDRGEIETAASGQLPTLITLDDIRGDLQMHTTASDGKASLHEMAKAAQERGYDYIAITDHSKHVSVAQGLDAKRLAKQLEKIDRLNEQLEGIQVLKSIEVDILKDGSLDLPDDILKELDLTVCSIHSHFKLSEDRQTDRIIRAMDNPYFNIFAHPTGRRLGEREPYKVDLERVMKAALERGCFLELNAHPERLDLNDVSCKMAKDMGVKLSISTDAHRVNELDYMRFGIGQARRGWLETEDVLNTRSWEELQDLLQR
jgi:DNA polymerase (family 10)